MAGLLDRVRGIRKTREEEYQSNLESARRDFFDIAVRDYLDQPNDNDADILLHNLEVLELTDEDYQNTVKGVGRVMAAAASCEFLTKQMEGNSEQLTEAQRQMHIAQGELKRAQRRVNDLSHLRSTADNAARGWRDVKKEFPNLIDSKGQPRDALRPLIEKRLRELAKDRDDAIKAADERIDAEVKHTLTRLGLLAE